LVLEHITTSEAAHFVLEQDRNVAATITPQHLLFNRNDMLVGGIKPHFYCLPILKRQTHQQTLLEVATSGNPKFFLGTDSAPHSKNAKENACGCAGCYSAPTAIELYAQAFDQVNKLERLEGFASHFGADFYGLPRNTETITLVKEEQVIPESFDYLDGDKIIPLYAGKTIQWRKV
jgi:dihydroorotase